MLTSHSPFSPRSRLAPLVVAANQSSTNVSAALSCAKGDRLPIRFPRTGGANVGFYARRRRPTTRAVWRLWSSRAEARISAPPIERTGADLLTSSAAPMPREPLAWHLRSCCASSDSGLIFDTHRHAGTVPISRRASLGRCFRFAGNLLDKRGADSNWLRRALR